MAKEHDPVEHPSHYTSYPHEVIELTEHLGFCLGNAVKYVLRAPFKGSELQDLKKARWYVNRVMENEDDLVDLGMDYEEFHELAASFKDPIVDVLVEFAWDLAEGHYEASALELALDLIDDRIKLLERKEPHKEEVSDKDAMAQVLKALSEQTKSIEDAYNAYKTVHVYWRSF